jgi:hypothetical protein
MPKSKTVPKVVTYEPNPACPQSIFEWICSSLDRVAVYQTSVFDIGEDVLAFLRPEMYNSSTGEYVYEDTCIVTVRRKVNGTLNTINVRFASSKIAAKLFGKASRPTGANVYRRMR